MENYVIELINEKEQMTLYDVMYNAPMGYSADDYLLDCYVSSNPDWFEWLGFVKNSSINIKPLAM